MNKLAFWTGLGLFSTQLVGALGYMISQSDLSWLTNNLAAILGISIWGLFNAVCLFLMFYGLFEKEKKEEEYYY